MKRTGAKKTLKTAAAALCLSVMACGTAFADQSYITCQPSIEYAGLENLGGGYFTNGVNIYNSYGDFIGSYDVTNIQPCGDGLFMARKSGAYGLINPKGETVADFKYEDIKKFSGGLAVVEALEDGQSKWGFIDENGKEVIKPEYDLAGNFSDGLAPVGRSLSPYEYSIGYINEQGETVIEPKYSKAGDFSEGYALVSRSGTKKMGFIDKNGNPITEFKYDDGSSFAGGTALLYSRVDSAVYAVDTEGKIQNQVKISPSAYCDFASLENDRTTEGERMVFRTEEIINYENGETGADGSDHYHKSVFYNNRCQEISYEEYLKYKNYSEGVTIMYNDTFDKYTYADLEGNQLIDGLFDHCEPFYEGYAVVSNGRYYCGIVKNPLKEAAWNEEI